ncbi:hypothetical protein BDY21DRAFT_385451 [Lineolata rhizophorae]|uniref:Uncharacterized protein n=1 Tax=Lineolata rhizophorae TaxID=578093 RepID=A0A6A6P3H5_9PEZI|nr:hypothetical protein BDY21DRAFT_385451 [Lineolata rhizophorae]
MSPGRSPKSVLITGCSKGGIGDALAQEFKSRGLRVFATARNPAKIEHLKELGCDTLLLDVTSQQSIDAAVKSVSDATLGTLDILVNNAGAMSTISIVDANIDDVKRVFDTNFWSVVMMSKAFLPLLIATSGILANVSSISPITCSPFQGYYSCSKAALRALSDTMCLELKPFGVRVVSLVTGSVTSHLIENGAKDALVVPEGSYYAPLADWLNGRKAQSQAMGKVRAISAEKYARQTANDLLKKNPKWISRRGGFIKNRPTGRHYGLDKLEAPKTKNEESAAATAELAG